MTLSVFPLMNSFNKTDAAIFPMQAILHFPFFRLIEKNNKTNKHLHE